MAVKKYQIFVPGALAGAGVAVAAMAGAGMEPQKRRPADSTGRRSFHASTFTPGGTTGPGPAILRRYL